MFDRVLDWMDDLPGLPIGTSVTLAHGTACLNDTYDGLLRDGCTQGVGDGADEAVVAHNWPWGRKRGTLAQFVIGTIDQVLFAGLKERVDVSTYQRPRRSAQYGYPMHVDTSFDFRSDTPAGKDPDGYSPILRSYHKFLWSRDLPNGVRFTLNDDTPNEYLHHKSQLGEFFLVSDACLPTYDRYPAAASIISRVPDVDRRDFDVITYTIGGMMIFPGDKRDGKMTINGAKGFHPRIRDRMDLTLECISNTTDKKRAP